MRLTNQLSFSGVVYETKVYLSFKLVILYEYTYFLNLQTDKPCSHDSAISWH